MSTITPPPTPEIYPFTKKNHRDTYPSIDPANPALSAAGKTIFITGGATGVGLETARAFAIAGAAKIILVARSVDTLATAKKDLSATYPKSQVVALPLDITKADDVEKAFGDLRKDGDVDVVVLSAAVAQAFQPVLQSSAELLESNFSVNVVGNLNVVRTFLSNGVKDKLIINVSTGAAHLTFPGMAVYSITKNAFTQLLDHVYAEHKDQGLKVVQLHPGVLYTPMAKGHGLSAETFDWDDIKLPAHFNVWLASPEASFLSGKFVWSAWDVDELKEKKEEILADPTLLTIGLRNKA